MVEDGEERIFVVEFIDGGERGVFRGRSENGTWYLALDPAVYPPGEFDPTGWTELGAIDETGGPGRG